MKQPVDKWKAVGVLCFDLAGYGKLDRPKLEAFHNEVWADLADIIGKDQGLGICVKKTVGDGLVLIVEDYYQLALVALELRDYFNNHKYADLARGALQNDDLKARISLVIGQVRVVHDPIEDEATCIGYELVLCARIEPIVEAGHVFCTFSTVSQLYNSEKQRRGKLAWIPRGWVDLPKDFGGEEIWEIARAGEQNARISRPRPQPAPSRQREVWNPNCEGRCYPQAIDAVDAEHIMSLTGQDPRTSRIRLCGLGLWDHCSAHVKNLRLLSDVSRNGESTWEKLCIAGLLRSAALWAMVVNHNHHEKILKFEELLRLRGAIEEFLNAFKRFDRHYGKDDFGKAVSKPTKRPQEFLNWRTQNTRENQDVTPFVDAVAGFLSECRKGIRRDKWPCSGAVMPNQISDVLMSKIIIINETATKLAGCLESRGDQRITSTRGALQGELSRLSGNQLLDRLTKAVEELEKRNGSLPSNWRGPSERSQTKSPRTKRRPTITARNRSA
jgi:hypothetical protein